MVQIKIDAQANLKGAQAQFDALTAQVDALNKAMAKVSMTPVGGTTSGFKALQTNVAAANREYTAALASSGAFRVEQLKVNDAVAKHTDLLKQQKLGIADVFGSKNRGLMQSMYKEQLALQHAVAGTNAQLVGDGSLRMNLAIPSETLKQWDTLGNRIGFFQARLTSASHTLINWGKNTQWAGRQLMAGLTYPMAAAAAGAGVLAFQVDQQLTRVAKVYNTTANQNSSSLQQQAAAEKELSDLRSAGMKTAMEAAQQYGASAKDTLSVQADLAAAGYKGIALQQNTASVMKYAMLGEIDYNTATQTTIALIQQLGLSAKGVSDEWNYMNSVENATSLSMKDFAKAIPIALGPLKMMGGTVQDLGTLLTGMVSRGMQVGKAANAIKAAAQRLLRPSKQVQEEFQQITGQSITDIAAKNKGNLVGMLTDIYNLTKNLSQYNRGKVLAGLFGSYQLATMSAMVDSMGDLQQGVGQVSTAFKIGQQSAEQWQKVTDREISQVHNSISGTLKRDFATLQIQLAEFGQPFLHVADIMLKGLNGLMKIFNTMPGWAKSALLLGAGLAAITGPILMLIGLSANLIGNVGTLVARLLKYASTMDIVTRNETAMSLATKLLNNDFIKQADETQVMADGFMALTTAVDRYAESMKLAYEATTGKEFPTIPTTPFQSGMVIGTIPKPTITAPIVYPSSPVPVAPTQISGYNLMAGPMAPRIPSNDNSSLYSGQTLSNEEKLNKLFVQNATLNDAVTESMAAQAAKAESLQAIQKKTTESITGGRLAMAAMGASMALMVTPSGKVGHNIGEWLMVGTFVVPAFKALIPLIASASARMSEFAAAQILAARSGIGSAKSLGGIRVAGSALKGIGLGLAETLGPGGMVALGVAALGFGAYKEYKHIEDIQKQAKANQDALNNSTDTWADILGVVVKRYKEISVPSIGFDASKPIDSQIQQFKDSSQGKDILSQYGNANDVEKSEIALQQYLKVLQETNGSAAKAKQALEIMFRAAGDGAIEAQTKTMAFIGQFGSKASQKSVSKLWSLQLQVSDQDMAKGLNTIQKRGTEIGNTLANAIASAKSPTDKIAVLEQFGKVADQKADDFWTKWSKGPDTDELGALTFGGFFKQLGIQTEKQFDKFMDNLKQYNDRAMTPDAFQSLYPGLNLNSADQQRVLRNITQVAGAAQNAAGGAGSNQAAYAALQVLKDQLGIKKQISTVDQLMNTYEWKLYTVTKATAPEVYKLALAKAQEANAEAKKEGLSGLTNKQLELQALNEVRVAMGLKTTNNLADGFTNKLAEANNQLDKAKDTVQGMSNMSIDVNINTSDLEGIFKTAMTNTQDAIATQAQDSFTKQMNASIAAYNAGWTKQVNALKASQTAATNALDARWKRRDSAMQTYYENQKAAIDKAYKDREDKVDKEIKAEENADAIRQKIFQAEQNRIQRLAQMQDQNIDFNVDLRTGQLDEAAKIMNDKNAQVSEWALSDAADAEKTASQRREDRLNKEKDSLEKQQQARDAALEKQEKHAEARMQREEAAQKAHLAAMQKAELQSLEAREKQAEASYKAQWTARQTELNNELDLFKSYVPKNEQQLQAWMETMRNQYSEFGKYTLDPMSKTWGGYFKTNFIKNLRAAGIAVSSDNNWGKWGNTMLNNMLQGFGFSSTNAFEKFLKTGNLPSDFGKTKKKGNPFGGSGPAGNNLYAGGGTGLGSRHEGGWVNSDPGSRAGVARHAPLQPNEYLMNLKRGEFVMNERASRLNASTLEAMNEGKIGIGGAGNVPPGIPAVAETVFAGLMARGLYNALGKYINKNATAGGNFAKGSPGVYGGVDVDAAQMKNAQIIANVGKTLKMSNRDIEIAIMTAITESGLRNINYGDRDSLGLFQQRPSQGWGTPSQVTNPRYASTQFYDHLRGIGDRGSMAPWLAAQAVQRSAFSDGSNYERNWAEAIAIFKSMGQGKGGSTAGVYVAGSGGKHVPISKHWPIVQGIHDAYTGYPAIDIGAPVGQPIYAVGNGVITKSYDIRGYEPRRVGPQDGYKSYGRVMYLKTDGGPEVLYAHLSQRGLAAGARVKGGSIIGKSGNTGNTTGPHLHFGSKGTSPYTYFENGGHTLSEGLAHLHPYETVLSKPLSQDLSSVVSLLGSTARGIKSGGNVASWGGNQYNLEVHLHGTNLSADEVADVTIRKIKQAEERKPSRRTNRP